MQQLRAEDEKASCSPPPIIPYRRPGPKQPAYGIPTSEWPIVLHRVIEKKESLRTVAAEYGVAHETVRRVIRAVRKQQIG